MLKREIKPSSAVRKAYRHAAKKRKMEQIKELTSLDAEYVVADVAICSLSKMPKIEYQLTPDGKIPVSVANSVTTDELLDLLLRSKCLVKKIIPSRSTFSAYIGRIDVVRKLINASSGFDFFMDTDVIVNFVNAKYTNESSRSTVFRSFASIAGRIDGLDMPHKIFSDLNSSLSSIINKKLEENSLTKQQQKSWLDWNEIISLAPAVQLMSLKNQIVYALYTELPPRRVLEYATLIVFVSDQEIVNLEQIPADANYLIFNKLLEPVGLSLSIYKTSKQYGTFRNSIVKYSNIFNLIVLFIGPLPVHGRNVFYNKDGVPYCAQMFAKTIGNIFEKASFHILGKHIRVTANVLRHSFITEMLENISYKELYKTVAARSQLAFSMGHSFYGQALYAKYFADE